MITKNTLKLVVAAAMNTWAGTAFAHERHGFFGTHWHATDVWGFVAAAGTVALAVWLTHGGK